MKKSSYYILATWGIALVVTLLNFDLSLAANQARQQNRFADKCTQAQERVTTRLNNHNTIYDKHHNAYNNLITRLETFITKAKAAGYDTAKLEQDVAELKTKVEKFVADNNQYAQTLTQLQTGTCNQGETTFRDSLTQARTQVKAMHEGAQTIRAFIRETIKTGIAVIRAQTPAQNAN
ncbi:MAG: hypothetical protein AAB360_03455 [Patescibacteria group bacterium]